MDKYNTHGGYFAPQGLLKINEGGKHDENPNGGVQIGVDQQGIPNLVEEGEVIFDDFVYSDNIKADGGFLKENNIPAKYEGQLYSDIAGKIADEAEEQIDPITLNGVRAMLGRLANAQEAQKKAEEEKALMEELKNMSPEELAALEQALAQEQEMPEEQIQPEVVPTEIAPEQVVPQQPVMAMGGPVNKFDVGGPDGAASGGGGRGNEVGSSTYPRNDVPIIPEYPEMDLALAAIQPGTLLEKVMAPAVYKGVINGIASGEGEAISSFMPGPVARQTARTAGPIVRGIGRGLKKIGKGIAKAPKLLEVKGRGQMISEAEAAVREAREASRVANEAAQSAATELKNAKAALKADPTNVALRQQVADLEAASAKADATALSVGAKKTLTKMGSRAKEAAAVTVGPMYNRNAFNAEVESLRKAYESAEAAAKARPKSKELREAADAALEALNKAEGNWNKWWKHGEWQLKGALGGGAAGYAVGDANKRRRNEWMESQFGNGGKFNLLQNGTPVYGRTPDGQLVQIVERTDGDGTTWKEYIPVKEAGTIDPAMIVQLPEVTAYGRQLPGVYVEHKDVPWMPKIALPNAQYDEVGGRFLPDDYAALWGRIPAPAQGQGAQDIDYTPLGDVVVEGRKSAKPEKETKAKKGASSATTHSAQPASAPVIAGADPADYFIDDITLDDIINAPFDTYVPGEVNQKGIELTDTPVNVPELSKELMRKARRSKDTGFDPRYLSPLADAAMGLATLATPADHYEYKPIRPYIPTGYLRQQYERYNPIDVNVIYNQMQAQNTANARALLNSGAGPATAALINSADYNGGIELGNALANIWDANNQRRNQVISQNNAADAAVANFDWQTDATRANILNQFAPYNQQNALRISLLNNQAEQDKYNALAGYYNSAKKSLVDTATERMNRNAANTDTSLMGYWVDALRRAHYDPTLRDTLLKTYNGEGE